MTEFGSKKWFDQLSAEDYSHVVGHAEKQIRKTFSVSRLKKNQQDKINSHLLKTMEMLNRLNLEHRPSKTHAFKLLFQTLPKFLEDAILYSEIEATALQHSVGMYERSLKMYEATKKLYEKFLEWERAAKPKNNHLSMYDGITLSESGTVLLDTQTPFPMVNKLMDKVKALAESAVLVSISTEDAYFVEQVVKQYLPDISDSSKNLTLVTDSMKQTAEKNYLQQLNLLAEKLESLIDTANEKALQQVLDQTQFLTEKLVNRPKELTR